MFYLVGSGQLHDLVHPVAKDRQETNRWRSQGEWNEYTVVFFLTGTMAGSEC